MAKVIAALKPDKPADNPGSYRPISLLCVPYKLYERLIYNRIKLVIESVLPEGQAGFRPNCCTLDHVVFSIENIEALFSKKLNAGIVFVDISAAYDTAWHRGLTLKLLRTIPNKEMVRTIMGMISQRCFHVHIGKSKLRCWNILSGAPQGSVIAPALFNLFTYDIPATVSRKYIYADDTALMASDTCFLVVEQTFSDDLDKLRNCFYSWRLKFNTTKTVCSAFHLTNRLANYELSMRESHSIKLQSISVTLWPCTLLPPTLTKHRSKKKQTLQPNEETCQQPVGSWLHNFLYFYTCFVFLLLNTVVQYGVKAITAKKSTHLEVSALDCIPKL